MVVGRADLVHDTTPPLRIESPQFLFFQPWFLRIPLVKLLYGHQGTSVLRFPSPILVMFPLYVVLQHLLSLPRHNPRVFNLFHLIMNLTLLHYCSVGIVDMEFVQDGFWQTIGSLPCCLRTGEPHPFDQILQLRGATSPSRYDFRIQDTFHREMTILAIHNFRIRTCDHVLVFGDPR